MSIEERLAPALRPLAAARIDLSAETLDQVRDSLNERRRTVPVDLTGVDVLDTDADGVPVRIYRRGRAPAPAIVFCHSGAFVLGNLDTDHRWCVEMSRTVGCAVISVDYRLAPEHPYPAAAVDAASVLRWAAENSAELGIDVARIALAGNSAGGALAAGLALRSAAGDLPPVVFQLLHQPVLDDRLTPAKQEFTTTPGFDGAAVELMWRYYRAGTDLPVRAVPGRCDELSGVPTTLITCSELDPLRDEAIDYALRLMWAGVAVELHVYPGTCHGFDSLLPDWQTSAELRALQASALRRALLS
ncbi:MAG: alpha/beta hydrolase [Mycobacterium sp.]